MSIENIVFEKTDSDKETAIKTQMKRLNIEYTKVCRGLKTSFVLKSNKIGKVTVTL